MSEPYGREELEKATREYVDRLKEAYPGINERDLYDLVYEIARQRIAARVPLRSPDRKTCEERPPVELGPTS